jgi:hypothetical protein
VKLVEKPARSDLGRGLLRTKQGMPSASCRIDERKVGNKCTVAATLFGRLAVGLSCGAQPSEPNRKRKGLQAFNNNRLLPGQRHAILVWRISTIVFKPQPCVCRSEY